MDAADLEHPLLRGGDGEEKKEAGQTVSRCRLTRQCKSDLFMGLWLTLIVIAAFCFQWQIIENQVRLFGAMRCTRDPPDTAQLQEAIRVMADEVREELLVFRSELYNVYSYVDQHHSGGHHSPHDDMYDHPPSRMIID
jgi:hypothetical protein